MRQRAYRTPHALKDKVQAEIDNMLKLGIIELNLPLAPTHRLLSWWLNLVERYV